MMIFKKQFNKRLYPSQRKSLLDKLSEEELILLTSGGLDLESADLMRENVIGLIHIPLGLAYGFIVNGRELVVPMATEDRSIISMAEKGAALAISGGGFSASSAEQIMIGQIQLIGVPDTDLAKQRIIDDKSRLLKLANTVSKTRRALDIQFNDIETQIGQMLIVELLVDVRDSMGSNVVDSMCEKLSPLMASLSGGRANTSVVSNLATERMVHAEATIPKEALGGGYLADRIVEAYSFAEADQYRAATHNKGIMNGITAVLLATSNDTRAVEAGAHAYAAMSGRYRPLSVWRKNDRGDLVGEIEVPMQVGVIGGAVSTHPVARLVLKVIGVKTAAELGEIVTSVGLACNLGAIYSLVTTGITKLKTREGTFQ
jgi:hydroxymethylglutaryl-CoA reductase